MGDFMNDIHFSLENLSQEKIQNLMDIRHKIKKAIIASQRGLSFTKPIWAVDLRQVEYDFYERNSTNFDEKSLYYGEIDSNVYFHKLPGGQKRSCRFTINNDLPSTYETTQ